MATLEKFSKAMDTLKLYGNRSVGVDVNMSYADKMAHCQAITESLCQSSSAWKPSDFAKYLNVSMEMFFTLLDDPQVDVRLMADENLNKVIHHLMEAYGGRIQVELFKEIKKNGSARSVRTALVKFAELAANIRPLKCRPYVVNLLPCLVKIARRQEEILHEALASALPQIFQVLGGFTNDNETRLMLKTYVVNLFDVNVVIRRSTAFSLTAICMHSRKKNHFLPWLLGTLLDFLVPITPNEDTPSSRILGILACIRLLIPEIAKLTQAEDETSLVKRFLQIYELCLHYLRHQDHSIVSHALEVLQALMKSPPDFFLPILTSPSGIKHSYIFDTSTGAALASSVSRMSSLVIDEDEENLLDLEPSVVEETPRGKVQIMGAPEVQSPKLDDHQPLSGMTDDVSSASSRCEEEEAPGSLPQGSLGLETVESSGDESGRGTPERATPEPLGMSTPTSIKSLMEFENIGHFEDGDIPLIFCARKIIRAFLLTPEKGCFVPDSRVRVSTKTLAFGCLTHILRLCPKIFLLTLCSDQDEEDIMTPLVRDVVNFTTHDDPQVRGCVAMLLGTLLNGALIESGGNLELWFNQRRPDQDDILSTFHVMLQDKSPMTIRWTLQGLGTFLPRVCQSLSARNIVPLFQELQDLSASSYWLVKAELCELISNFPFLAMKTLTHSCNIQAEMKSILVTCLQDEDPRIRSHAAKALVKIIPNMYSQVDDFNENPVIFEASRQARRLLDPILTGFDQPWSDSTQFERDNILQNVIFRTVDELYQKLLVCDNAFATSGVIEALFELTKAYPPKHCPKSWGCQSRRVRKSSSARAEAICSSPGFDQLRTLKDLLIKSATAHDLAMHMRLMEVASALFEGLAIAHEGRTASVPPLPLISTDKKLNDVAMDIFVHCVRLFSVSCSIIEAAPPQNNTPKPAINTLPSPGLSPMKKPFPPGSSLPGITHSNPMEKGSKTPSNDPSSTNPDNSSKKMGSFSHSTHYLRFYEILKNLHRNHLVTLNSKQDSKFVQVYTVALNCATTILNSSWGNILGRNSEEFLAYLKTNINVQPLQTLMCVQAFLKCIFRSNDSAGRQGPSSPGHAHLHVVPKQKGLFNPCFDVPYNELVHTFHLARDSVSIPDRPETAIFQTMRAQQRVNKANMFKTLSKATDRGSLASCIRLFEPIVIKALKLYTLTSEVNQQAQVLQLLTQLIQLRVNYCLLDSDQIFIGFVQKQLDLIEESQIANPGPLIEHIFKFLVLLSYEKYHSKQIIDMAKILRFCEGLFASGQDARTFVLPALIPVAQDLFENRSNTGGDMLDLDSQREMVLNMLLKLIIYPETLEALLHIMGALKIEAEEKWRKVSRTVVDVLIPLLASQKIHFADKPSLDLIHGIFASLCPSSLRPVDPLLSAMLTCSVDLGNLKEVERWVGFILVSLAAITNQSPEEGILGGLEELGIQVGSPSPQALLDTSMESSTSSSDPLGLGFTVKPEITFAKFLIQVIGASCSKLHQITYSQSMGASGCFLEKEISHLLLFVSYMFQSGRYIRVVKAAQALARGEPDENDMLTVNTISDLFLQLSHVSPLLTLQWLYILVLMNHCPQGYWNKVLAPDRKVDGSVKMRFPIGNPTACVGLNQEIVKTGGLILFCDYLCENISNVEATSWLVINYVWEVIMNFKESPVQDFIMSMHSSAASSELLFQAIASRCDRVNDVLFLTEALSAMDNVHPSHTGKLLVCLVKRFLLSPILALARSANVVICLRLEHLLKNGVEQVKQCLPETDLAEILELLRHKKYMPRFGRLISLLNRLSNDFYNLSPIEGEEIRTFHPGSISNLKADQDWFVSQTRQRTCSPNTGGEVCAELLAHLDFDEIMNIMNQKDFKASVLGDCFHYAWKVGFPPGKAFLLDAAKTTLVGAIKDVVDNLPKPFAILKPEHWPNSPGECKYFTKLESTFAVNNFRDALASYQEGVMALLDFDEGAVAEDDLEVQESLSRFGILCLEFTKWLMSNTMENVGSMESQISRSLRTVARLTSNAHVYAWMGRSENHLMTISAVFCLESIAYDHFKWSKSTLEMAKCFKKALESSPQENQAIVANVVLGGLFQNVTSDPSIDGDIRDIILALSRLQMYTTYIRTPPMAWKLGWDARPSGTFGTEFPIISVDLLQDVEVLRHYVQTTLILGWNSRHQFEEIWMSLLGIFSINTDEFREDEIKALSHCSALVVQALTAVITNTMYLPKPGLTNLSKPIHSSRDWPSQFLMSPRGQQLTAIQNYLRVFLEREGKIKSFLNLDSSQNLERYHESPNRSVGFSQVSVVYIMHAIKHCEELSEGGDSKSNKSGAISLPYLLREDCLVASGMDIQSCLHFLFDLYSQWLQNPYAQETPLNLLTETVRSILALSDLFTDVAHFQWMFGSLSELQRMHPVEDEVMNALLCLGLAKSLSIIGGDADTIERVRKVIEAGLKRSHLPSKICALHGILYLLQTGEIPYSETLQLLPFTKEYVSVYLQNSFLPRAQSEQHLTLIWSVAFYIMENLESDLVKSTWSAQTFQMAIGAVAKMSTPRSVFKLLLAGLERLVVGGKLDPRALDQIVKLSTDLLTEPNPAITIPAVQLFLVCMYSSTGSHISIETPSGGIEDPERLMQAMEQMSILFDCIRRAGASEARLLCAILPKVLVDFFPASDVINRVVSEFMSPGQPHQVLLSGVLFAVFKQAASQNQTEMLKEWVLMALPNFTKRLSMPHSIWCLSCFFIAASSHNPWLQSFFPVLQRRFAMLHHEDRKLFCLAAREFFQSLAEDEQKAKFIESVEELSEPNSPYSDLLHSLRQLI